MRNTIITLAAGLLLSVSSAALADDGAVSAQPAAVSDSNKLVCHYNVHQGVLVRKAVCKTQSQWDRDRRESQRDFATFQMRTYSAPFRK